MKVFFERKFRGGATGRFGPGEADYSGSLDVLPSDAKILEGPFAGMTAAEYRARPKSAAPEPAPYPTTPSKASKAGTLKSVDDF